MSSKSRWDESLNISAVHTVLKRLEEKGLLKSEMGDPTTERGGRRKRIFLLTAAGKKGLSEANEMRNQLFKKIPKVALGGLSLLHPIKRLPRTLEFIPCFPEWTSRCIGNQACRIHKRSHKFLQVFEIKRAHFIGRLVIIFQKLFVHCFHAWRKSTAGTPFAAKL